MRSLSYVGLQYSVVLSLITMHSLSPTRLITTEEDSLKMSKQVQLVSTHQEELYYSEIIQDEIILPEVEYSVLLSELVTKEGEKEEEIPPNEGRYVGEILDFEATAYTPYCEGCSGITKTGLNVRERFHNVIAVDPSVIPLYSVIEVYHNGELYGVYEAQDTGGVIKGNIIDILHKTKKEAFAFGRQQVQIKIISLPEG